MTQYFQNFFHILYHRSFCFGNHFPFKWSEEKLQISWRLDSALFYISAYNNYLTSYFSDTISLSFFVLYSFICPNFKFTIFIKPISNEKSIIMNYISAKYLIISVAICVKILLYSLSTNSTLAKNSFHSISISSCSFSPAVK